MRTLQKRSNKCSHYWGLSVYQAYSKRSHAAPKAQPIRRKWTILFILKISVLIRHLVLLKSQRLNLKTGIIATLNENIYVQHMEYNKRQPVRNLASCIPDSMISLPPSFFGIHRSSVRNSFFARNLAPPTWLYFQLLSPLLAARTAPSLRWDVLTVR